jgi:4-hydroxy-tetrahydrodipicolinate synthase
VFRGSIAALVTPFTDQGEVDIAALRRQDWSRADELQNELGLSFEILIIETNPIPVKWPLFEMNTVRPNIRLPVTVLKKECRDHLGQCLQELGLSFSGSRLC